MKRIAILGCAGSGQSVLADRLADILGIAAINLDAVYYDEGWNLLADDEFRTVQREMIAADRWIIEGNHATDLALRLGRADTVVFLDRPVITRLWGILRRGRRNRGGPGIESAWPGVTWSRTRVPRPRRRMRLCLQRLLAEQDGQTRLIILTGRRQANRFLKILEQGTDRRRNA
jgi:hypothetical protein